MSSVLDKKEKNTVDFTMTVKAEVFAEAMDHAFRKNVKNIALPGFRKGKAPRKLIERTYGEAIFYDDAIDFVFPAEYEAAIKELGIDPVAMLDNNDSYNALKAVNGLIFTGPTGTNVNDLYVVLIRPKEV